MSISTGARWVSQMGPSTASPTWGGSWWSGTMPGPQAAPTRPIIRRRPQKPPFTPVTGTPAATHYPLRHSEGINVLYYDGHVKWRKPSTCATATSGSPARRRPPPFPLGPPRHPRAPPSRHRPLPGGGWRRSWAARWRRSITCGFASRRGWSGGRRTSPSWREAIWVRREGLEGAAGVRLSAHRRQGEAISSRRSVARVVRRGRRGVSPSPRMALDLVQPALAPKPPSPAPRHPLPPGALPGRVPRPAALPARARCPFPRCLCIFPGDLSRRPGDSAFLHIHAGAAVGHLRLFPG